MSTGELTRNGMLYKDSDYYVVRQPMPYVLKESNAYLVETTDGWAVIDVGVDLPSTREIWTKAIKEVGISFTAIHKIYVTHCHPDHHGACAWLQQVTGAPVFLLDTEIRRARQYIFMGEAFEADYRKAIEYEARRQGFSKELLIELVKDWHCGVGPLYPQPAEMLPLHAEQEIELAGETFKIIPAPGHADGMFALWCEGNRHMFSADIAADAYLHFSDWPNTNLANPLAVTISLIDRLLSLGHMTAFPGHGHSFTDLGSRLIRLRDLYERRLEKVRLAVTAPLSAGELYTKIWKVNPYVHHHRLTIGETIGYLNELTDRGCLHREETDRIRYAPCEQKNCIDEQYASYK